MTMKYNNQVTINNGVLPTPANIGQMLDLTVVLKDFATGMVHKTHKVIGKLKEITDIPTWNEIDPSWRYVVLTSVTLEDEHGNVQIVETAGWPLAQFINN